jgi:hypothetical protein
MRQTNQIFFWFFYNLINFRSFYAIRSAWDMSGKNQAGSGIPDQNKVLKVDSLGPDYSLVTL